MLIVRSHDHLSYYDNSVIWELRTCLITFDLPVGIIQWPGLTGGRGGGNYREGGAWERRGLGEQGRKGRE